MTRRQTIYFILAFTIIIAGFFLFKPGIWQNRIETYLNRQLNQNGWQVEISDISGHLFTTLHSDTLSLIHRNGASIFLPNITTRIKIISLMKGRIEIDQLYVSDVAIRPYFESNADSVLINSFSFTPENIPLNISKLRVDGRINVPFNDSTRAVQFLIDGRVNEGRNEMELDFEQFEIFCVSPKIDLAVQNIEGKLSSKAISVSIEKANFNGFDISGQFNFDKGEESIIRAQLDLS